MLRRKMPNKAWDRVNRHFFGDADKSPADILSDRSQLADAREQTGKYFPYLLSVIRKGKLYMLYQRFGSLMSPIFWIYRIFRWVLLAITWLEASAVLLLFTAVLLALFPPILVLTVAFLYGNAGEDKRGAAYLRRVIGERPVILLASAGGASPTAFACPESDPLYLVVPEREWASGFTPNLFFRSFYPVSENTFYIRESLFFQLKPFLLAQKNSGIVY